MALSGAASGPFVLCGAVVGGVVYSGWVRRFVNAKRGEDRENDRKKEKKEKVAVYEILGGGKMGGVVVYEVGSFHPFIAFVLYSLVFFFIRVQANAFRYSA
jgi:hypothetical protein